MDESTAFRSHPWRISYRTSDLHPDGRPVDILHDFYIPVLQRAAAYDRVAGYFSSSSLAAASQGFSTFVGRRSKARLIVGAELASEDVAAILEGDAERLARSLEERAFGEESLWPEAVTRGVELLGWMVAHGHLDIRVGFRVHRETGRPLPLASAADGYVHEKWALFTDAAGDKIHISGSLNESRTALVINAENLDLHCAWRNEENALRVAAAEASFAALWADQHPAFRVLTLPEAVRLRLIRYGERCRHPREIDGSSAVPETIAAGPSALERLRFHLIKDGPRLPRGRSVGMETAAVEPWPHQRVAARRIIRQWPGSQMLCDEVGLGKTIEAGLAIRSLVLSGLVRKVLIAAPASLTQQWQRELSGKFLLPFARALTGPTVRHEVLLPQPERVASRGLFDPDLLILSTGLLSRKERRQGLPRYDLALVDEAHYARRRNPTRGLRARPDYGHLYTAIRDDLRPKVRCLLLATATPMQLHPVEVADLLRLIPRVGPFQFDAGLMLSYYDLVAKLRRQETLDDKEWAFLTAVVRDLKILDPLLWRYLETATLDERGRRALQNWLGRGRSLHRTDYRLLNRLLFAGAPLSRVMLRHTRALLEVYSREGKLGARLARRQVLPIPPIRFTEQEERAYHQLETYCKALAEIMARNADDAAQRAAVGFYLSFLRLRFASCLYAIRETLRRRRERVQWTLEHVDVAPESGELDRDDLLLGEAEEDDPDAAAAGLRFRTSEDLRWEQNQLDIMLANLDDLSQTSSKTQYLLQVLDQRRSDGERIRQTVIFTRFFDTLEDLLRRLQTVRWNLRLGTYSGRGGRWFNPAVGRLVDAEREDVKRRFLRGGIDVLLCTDAAAEGLNLQTADLLVNFDLPWNPMKVEQRIGRIDRIGQRHDIIQVLNLCYLGSAEEQVYGRLLERLRAVGAIVGSQQVSLLPVTAEDFEALARGTIDAETLAVQAQRRAREAREQIERMEIPAEELYQIYTRAEQAAPEGKPPITLDHIHQALVASDWLAAQGCQVYRSDGGEWLKLAGQEFAGTALTISRTLLETGLPTGEREELHFASYGDPVFDRLLNRLTEFPLPDCVRRLTITVDDTSVVGYAVCARLSDGGHEIRLVDDCSQLEELTLAEDRQPSDAEIQRLESLLRQRAESVNEPTRLMPRIEAINRDVARDQQILNLLIIGELIKARQRMQQMQPLFKDEAEAIERIYSDDTNRRYPVRVNYLPADIIATFSRKGLPFQPVLPPMAKQGYVDAPPILIRAALDTAWRIADSIKRKGRSLESEQVAERLLREAKQMAVGRS